MTAPGFTAHGKQVLANGSHCADAATEIGAQHISDALNAWHAKGGWQPIETAPRDGNPFFYWKPGYEWPEVLRWYDYDEQDREEIGEDGYFTYAEELLSTSFDPIEIEDGDHWMPLPSAPVAA